MQRLSLIIIACSFGLLTACGHERPANDPSSAAPETAATPTDESLSPGANNPTPSEAATQYGSGSENPNTNPPPAQPSKP